MKLAIDIPCQRYWGESKGFFLIRPVWYFRSSRLKTNSPTCLKNFRRKQKLLQDNQTEIIDKMNNQSNQELVLATLNKYALDFKVVLESA